MKYLLPVFLLSLLTYTASFAQVHNIGNVTQAAINGNTVNLTTDGGQVRITVYKPNIIRVRMDKKALADDFSFAVVGKPDERGANISQTETNITITTDSLRAVVSKTPYNITFYTPDGRIISTDEKGFTTSWVNESVTTYKHMQDGERFIGLGEKTGPLDRAGNGYTNWNTDAFGYKVDQDPIYSTIPFYMGIHHGLNYGIFLDNTYQSDFNFGASNNRFSSFGARGGEMNYYFIYNTRVADIITSYTWLTGRMKLPPLWSLGYQQNRYSYYPESEVMRIAQTLREKKIPADGITLDIHYMDAYKLFTWNHERFPNPKAMTDKLKGMGFKTTVIVDPGIKVEPGYKVYEDGKKDDVFLKYPDGTYYTGQVWPGWCHFPDFTADKGRAWWRSEIKTYAADGVSGIWNDMNEIASWGQKMPDNILFNYGNHPTTHLQGHNVFGMQMARASYDGYREALGKRPFILTRAAYAGLQRYTAIWTGDNRSEDDHMLAGVRLLCSFGLSGVPFTGMDIGGFTGGPSPALFARWMQIGAFNPYFRNHTAVNTPASEPWAHGEEVLEISRNYVNLRYRLMPYLYSTFYEATQDGLPVVRSLAIDYTQDAKIYDEHYQNEYLFGKAMLVLPFVSGIASAKAYFPSGNWYNLYTDELQAGGTEKFIPVSMKELPVYVREGSIIPMESLVQSTAERPTDTLTVHVYHGTAPSTFVYYEDDGESYSYENGDYYRRSITYNPGENSLSFTKAEGAFHSKFSYLKVVMHGWNMAGPVTMNGNDIPAKADSYNFLSPISKFDPQLAGGHVDGVRVRSFIVKNEAGAFSVRF